MEHGAAQRLSSPHSNGGIRTHHRVAAAGVISGQLLGMAAKSVPLSAAAMRGARDAQSEPMYELVWQVGNPVDTVKPGVHHRYTNVIASLSAHSASALPSMLAVLQAAEVRGAPAVALRSAEQASTIDGVRSHQSSGASLGPGALQAMLRTFAQESSTRTRSLAADANAAGDSTRAGRSSFVLSDERTAGISDGYGSRIRAGTRLLARLLPSAARSTPGASGSLMVPSPHVRVLISALYRTLCFDHPSIRTS